MMDNSELTPQVASVIILPALIKSGERLFDERFNAEASITPDQLKILRRARDTHLDRLRENLRYAQRVAK